MHSTPAHRPASAGAVTRRRWRPPPWAPVAAVWVGLGVLGLRRDTLLSVQRWDLVLLGIAVDAAVWTAITLGLFRLAAARGRARRPGTLLALHAVLLPVVTLASTAVDWPLIHLLDPKATFVGVMETQFSRGVLRYAAVAAAGQLWTTMLAARDRAVRVERLQAELLAAQLQVLRAQIQPHFLFNTLNSIAELIHRDAPGAQRMMSNLSDLLRVTACEPLSREIRLRDEIEILRSYLQIQEVRFSDQLRVEWEIEPGSLEAQVPTLLLQPLAENALRHGFARRSAPGTLWITARRAGSRLRLEVRDDGAGVPRSYREGVGLANTRARLQHLHGPHFALELRNAPGGGAVSLVEIPFRTTGTPPPREPGA